MDKTISDQQGRIMRVERRQKERSIQVTKYKSTRYWAVWVNEDLLAVTVYKKGALAIKQEISPHRKYHLK